MHPSVWDRKCLFAECGGCPECSDFRWPSAPPSVPRRLTADTTDLEPFFASVGVEPLPLLDVTYNGDKLLLGALTRYSRADDGGDLPGGDLNMLRQAPSITWDASRTERALVLMMDLDAGGRASADGSHAGSEGPYVQGLWSGCTGGSLAHCRTLVRYEPPDVRQGTNRIAFLMLRQPAATWVRGVSMRPFVLNMTYFLEANYPAGERAAQAYNFFYMSGSEEEADLDPRRYPPWEAPPPPSPALPPYTTPTSPSPPPAPKPPAMTWWGGTETKRPWEHRL